MNKFKKFVASIILFLSLAPIAFAVSYGGYAHLDTSGAVVSAELGNVFSAVSNLEATVTGIDLKSTGQTTLYTCPSGKTCVITDVLILATSASTVAVAPVLRIGKASAYNEWEPLTTMTGLDTTNKFTSMATASTLTMHQTFAANEVIKVDVQTAATATALTTTAYVFGFNF